MKEIIRKREKNELIKDRQFILWVLCPTDELELYWQQYISLYPEEEATVEAARIKLKKLKVNTFTLSDIEKRQLKLRIKGEWERREQQKRRNLVWYMAAACIIILVILTPFWLSDSTSMPGEDLAYTASATLNNQQHEVELFTHTHKMEIANNAEIRITPQGKVEVPEEEIQAIEEQADRPANSSGKEQMNILKVPEGRRSSLTLSDGTKVWVNAGTVFRFPEQFGKDQRTVFVEGEIYLEVQKDATRPFYVKTSRMDVKVLGTSFCVNAYDTEKTQAVILKEGSVAVENHTGNKRNIRPNEMLVLNENQMTVEEVDAYEYISWVDGFLQFKERDLGNILNQLSRYYRVEFVCPEEVKSLKCSGKLVLFENIEQVLNTLQTTLPISCRKDGNQIHINCV